MQALRDAKEHLRRPSDAQKSWELGKEAKREGGKQARKEERSKFLLLPSPTSLPEPLPAEADSLQEKKQRNCSRWRLDSEILSANVPMWRKIPALCLSLRRTSSAAGGGDALRAAFEKQVVSGRLTRDPVQRRVVSWNP
ncbi:hypothetical protein AK812_SmicGene29826 [Symbiodinium microadriaticum]|uniref:Uncharacterized protein n=1 Tax=Symbiodinium microadriaticum TaxID=2951 RepID=A0A1Q9D0V7_SYMMI|nr:hypothetical protein AK812_SmicGene29826 [Symbiodinium microadriaticum]